MYKFTNGIVVFDEKTKNEMLSASYKLVEEQKIEEISSENSKIEEEKNENSSNSRTIKRQSKKCNKLSK